MYQDVIQGNSVCLLYTSCPIRHLGTEKAQQLYLNIQNYLQEKGVEMLFNTECDNIILENDVCKGVRIEDRSGVREIFGAVSYTHLSDR